MLDIQNAEKLNTDETFCIILEQSLKNGIPDENVFFNSIRKLSFEISCIHGKDIAVQFENAMGTKLTLYENVMDGFYRHNKNGDPTGIIDVNFAEYIIATVKMFVMGRVIYIYSNGCYIADESCSKIKSFIRKRLLPQFNTVNTIKRIYELLFTYPEIERSFEEVNQYPSHWICFQNGMYDPKENKMYRHSPDYYCINQIPHNYFPVEKHSGIAFDKWFEFAVPDGKDREMILEYIGLTATKDTSFQKFMLLCGEGGTGKSTLLRLCELFIGTKNTSNISLLELNQRFASFGLLGKLLNSCADLEIEALQDVSIIKKCLGEDSLRGEQKGRDAISFKNYAKLIFSTNELPFVKNEKSNGFFRRLLILEMNQIPEHMDADLFQKLSGDIDHFIALSMEALTRLYQRGCILESDNSTRAVERMRCDSDTVEAFIRDICVLSKEGRTKRTVLYEEYEKYCEVYSRQALTSHNFYKSMRLKRFKECTIVGSIHFVGISIKTDGDFCPVPEECELPFP